MKHLSDNVKVSSGTVSSATLDVTSGAMVTTQGRRTNNGRIKTSNIGAITLGDSRAHCQDYLTQHNLDSISFAHWLFVPSLKTVLIFKNQQCVAIETGLI